MPNTFDWIEIKTHDLQKAANFYTSLFGWTIKKKEGTEGSAVWIFDTGDAPRMENLRRGGIWLRPEGEPLGIVVYVVVADIDATLQKVKELGGQVVSAKAPVGSGYGAYLQDPGGNLLGLYQEKRAAPAEAE